MSEIERIAELMIDDGRERLAARDLTLEVTPAARRHIARAGYDPVYGARPLRRYIAHEVETRIARTLLREAVPDGATVHVDVVENDELVVTTSAPVGAST